MKKPATVVSHPEISPEKLKKISRRGFMQIVAVAGAAGALWQFGLRPESRHIVRRSVPMMGTVLNLTVIGADRDSAEAAVDATLARMHGAEEILSRFDPASEVARLNRIGVVENASGDLIKVVNLAETISQKTNGAFDITVLPLLTLHQQFKNKNNLLSLNKVRAAAKLVDYRQLTITGSTITLAAEGMGITLDGIGKGYVVDKGVAVLKKHGFANVFVEAGGDLMAAGTKETDRPWRVGIRNPRPGSATRLVAVNAADRAIATSGDYLQYFQDDFSQHHIINPATGFSPPELASSSVMAPSVALADGLATASMVLGVNKSLALLESWPGCEGFFIGKDMARHVTTGFFA